MVVQILLVWLLFFAIHITQFLPATWSSQFCGGCGTTGLKESCNVCQGLEYL